MTMIATEKHTWVKHTLTPVEVIDDGGHPVVFIDPDKQDQAEAEAAYGCDECGAAMATHFNTKCTGKAEDL